MEELEGQLYEVQKRGGRCYRTSRKKFTKLPWASQLQFLDSTLTDRERTSNVREPTPETSSDIETQSPETPQPEKPPPQTPPPRTPPPETPLLGTPQTNNSNSSQAKKI